MNTYRTTFTVEGRFNFPMDMLRYDACHPATGDDVAVIETSTDREARRALSSREGHRTERIKLVRVHVGKEHRITFDRWASFLWSVDRQSIVTERI